MAASFGLPYPHEILPQFLPINVTANGDNSLVAGIAGQSIYVLGLYLTSASAVTGTWKTGTAGGGSNVAIGGPIALTTAMFPLPFSPVGWYATAPGEALNLFLSGGVVTTGQLIYCQQ